MGISMIGQPTVPVALSSSAPVDVVTTAAAVGTANAAARGDHTHKLIDTGWLTPTLINGWAVYDALFGNAAMYRKIGNMVFLRGLVKNGTAGSVIYTLPVGYRPTVRMLFIVDATGGYGRLDIDPNGSVIHNNGATGYFQTSCSFVADA